MIFLDYFSRMKCFTTYQSEKGKHKVNPGLLQGILVVNGSVVLLEYEDALFYITYFGLA